MRQGAPLPSRRADVRFLLPHAPRTVALVGPERGWHEGLDRAGCRLVDRSEAHDTLIVTRAAAASWSPTPHCNQVLVEGATRTPAGWAGSRWQLAVRRDEPLACARPADGLLVRESIRRWAPSGPTKRLAQAVAVLLAGRAPVPLPVVTVLSREASSQPGLLSLATDLGAPPEARPLFVIGGGSLIRRVAVILHPPGSLQPTHVLKVHRLPAAAPDEPSHPDATSLERVLTARLAGVRVPAVLGTGNWDGLPATLEQAVPGDLLDVLLQRDPGRARCALDVLTGWLCALAAATAQPAGPGFWSAEAEGLAAPWPGTRALAAEAGRRLDACGAPSVVEHGDIANCGNVVVADEPSVIDWESAKACGLPLADPLPMLVHGLAVMCVGSEPQAIADEIVRLCTGRASDSASVGRMVRSYLERLDLPLAAAGPLALLAWLRHGQQVLRHQQRLRRLQLPPDPVDSVARLVAERWIVTPGLGLEWAALSRC